MRVKRMTAAKFVNLRFELEVLLLLDSSHCEAGDEAIEEEGVQDGSGNAWNEGSGHQRPPLEEFPDELRRHSDAHRF